MKSYICLNTREDGLPILEGNLRLRNGNIQIYRFGGKRRVWDKLYYESYARHLEVESLLRMEEKYWFIQ